MKKFFILEIGKAGGDYDNVGYCEYLVGVYFYNGKILKLFKFPQSEEAYDLVEAIIACMKIDKKVEFVANQNLKNYCLT